MTIFQTARYKENRENDVEDISETKLHYSVLQSELSGELSKELEEQERIKYCEEIDKLTTNLQTLEDNATDFKEKHEKRMEEVREKYTNSLSKLRRIAQKLMKTPGNNLRYVCKYKIPIPT